MTGFEPATTRTTIWCSTPELHPPCRDHFGSAALFYPYRHECVNTRLDVQRSDVMRRIAPAKGGWRSYCHISAILRSPLNLSYHWQSCICKSCDLSDLWPKAQGNNRQIIAAAHLQLLNLSKTPTRCQGMVEFPREDDMPRYRQIDQTNLMLQIDLNNQLLPDHSTIADFISRHAENDALVDEDTAKAVDHLNETIQRI